MNLARIGLATAALTLQLTASAAGSIWDAPVPSKPSTFETKEFSLQPARKREANSGRDKVFNSVPVVIEVLGNGNRVIKSDNQSEETLDFNRHLCELKGGQIDEEAVVSVGEGAVSLLPCKFTKIADSSASQETFIDQKASQKM